jgi:hypothetical protein
MQLHFCANKASQLQVFKKTNTDCMSVIVIIINTINLLAGLPTTKVIMHTLEAEWLHNNCDNCNAQISQRNMFVSNIYYTSPMCYVCISLPLKKETSYKCKLFTVGKMKLVK